ncbi:MAG TPA: acyl-CoA dehydrogenase family protein, partial [Rhodothermales bacterium]
MDLPLYHFLASIPWWVSALLIVALFVTLGFRSAPLWAWIVSGAVVLYGLGAPLYVWGIFALVVLFFAVRPLRLLLSRRILAGMRASGFMPPISATEQAALDAGTVWVEGELFSGKPDFGRLTSQPYPMLSPEEQAFLDGPVEEVCRMTDDWKVINRRDLPREVWDFLGEERFFGMIIPREYGGLGFSPLANSAVVQKLT